MAHTHQLNDNDTHFLIDAESRQIATNAKYIKLMQHDNNSEVFTFEMPRYIEGHDMTLCDHVQVHYSNIGNDERSDDFYEVTDVHTKEGNDSVIIFTWMIKGTATRHVGALHFNVRFVCSTDDATDYAWSTRIFTGVSVESSLYNSAAVIEQNPDAFLMLEKKIEDATVQPDWNQNDSSAASYIQNRPFYTENILQEVYIDNQNLTFEKNDDLKTSLQKSNDIYVSTIPDSLTAQVGDSLIVDFDGTEYELIVEVDRLIASNRIGCSVDKIGEEISFSLYENWGGPGNLPDTGWVILTTSEGTSHTISIKKVDRRITKIPSKYIDSSKFKEDVSIFFNYVIPTDATCGVGTMEVTYKKIRDMLSNNKNVIVYTNLSERLIPVSYGFTDIVFFGVKFSTTENYGGKPTLIFINNNIAGRDIDNGVEWNIRKIALPI